MNQKILFHNYWMKIALLEAEKGLKTGEVPVGAILLQNNIFLSSGYNSCIIKNNPNAHAEILAIKRGGRIINNYRFKNTSLYVTHEPCFMCSGAILNARINRIIFGSYNTNNTGLFFFLKSLKINHKKYHIKEIMSGIRLNDCSNLLKFFFKKKRKLKFKKY